MQDILGKNKTILVEQKVTTWSMSFVCSVKSFLKECSSIVLSMQIDYSIMGGLVIEFGQKVFDMSIRTRAKQMEAFLRQPLDM